MFLFQKYIHPTWYYNLTKHAHHTIVVDKRDLPLKDQLLLSPSNGYRTSLAERMDYAYQALQKGFIPKLSTQRTDLQDITVVDVIDNYRFVQRYFGKAKAIYILLIRTILLKNPLLELYALVLTWKQKRENIFDNHKYYNSFHTFESALIKRSPLVSVIIPTLNRYEYLKDALFDLESQTYKNFEVLICDQSEPLDPSFYQGWNLDLKLIPQSEKALWLARNRCIEVAKGNYILLFDDDSRVEPDWIEQHLRCLDYFDAAISAGVTHTVIGHGLSPKETYFHLSDVLDTGNTLLKRNVFESIGLFDRQFEGQRMGDGEFGLRALLGGFPSISNPYAMRVHLKVETGGLRQMGSWDALRPQKLLAARPVPSVLYLIRRYFGNRQAIMYIIQNVPFSFVPYNYKKSKLLKVISTLLLPALLPLIIWSVAKSWGASTKKLEQGSIIPKLS